MGALLVFTLPDSLLADPARWSENDAQAWYEQQPWLVGSNYIPEDAINELEMWQAESFNPAQIDKELGWAEDMGMNTMRVFLHDLPWTQNPEGFRKRIDQFLEIGFSAPYQAAVCAVRLVLGSAPEARRTTSPDTWSSQLKMGSVSGQPGAR
jgi:hypothetical protein